MNVSKTPDGILAMLNQPLAPGRVAKRKGAGNRELSYLESYDVIDNLNRIFGFDGWQDRVLSIEPISAGLPNGAMFRATVSIAVCIGDRWLTHEDVGIGVARSNSPEELEKCVKECVSDALKRAARKLGDQFGNCLYNKDAPEHITQPYQGQQRAPQPPQRAPQAAGRTNGQANGHNHQNGANRSQNGTQRPTAPALDGDPVSPINELCKYAGSLGMDNPTPPNVQAALKRAGADFQAVTPKNLPIARTLIKNFIEGTPPEEADPFSDN